MSKSIMEQAWEKFRHSDPGWSLELTRVCGYTEVALVAVRMDPYFKGRKQYGQVMATYKRRDAAEKAFNLLNERKTKLLQT